MYRLIGKQSVSINTDRIIWETASREHLVDHVQVPEHILFSRLDPLWYTKQKEVADDEEVKLKIKVSEVINEYCILIVLVVTR